MSALEETTAKFPKRLVSCARRYLTDNEQILEMAQQNGLAWGQAKDVVLTTENRILFLRRHWFGGVACQDIQWQDVNNVHVRQRIFSSNFTCHLEDGGKIVMGCLHRKQAAGLYRVCQQREQDWRERCRIRAMEEDYAKSGGFRMEMPSMSSQSLPAPNGPPTTANPRIQLDELKQLFEEGYLDEAEYQAKRAEIIERM